MKPICPPEETCLYHWKKNKYKNLAGAKSDAPVNKFRTYIKQETCNPQISEL